MSKSGAPSPSQATPELRGRWAFAGAAVVVIVGTLVARLAGWPAVSLVVVAVLAAIAAAAGWKYGRGR